MLAESSVQTTLNPAKSRALVMSHKAVWSL
jgi:hypothetical protein